MAAAAIQAELPDVLESEVSGTTVAFNDPVQGVSGTVKPLSTFLNADGSYCRAYEASASHEDGTLTSRGVACRDEAGHWLTRVQVNTARSRSRPVTAGSSKLWRLSAYATSSLRCGHSERLSPSLVVAAVRSPVHFTNRRGASAASTIAMAMAPARNRPAARRPGPGQIAATVAIRRSTQHGAMLAAVPIPLPHDPKCAYSACTASISPPLIYDCDIYPICGERKDCAELDVAVVERYQLPTFGIEVQGSLGGSASPCCSSSIEMPSGDLTNAMRPSRGGRLMVTPLSISCWQVA